MQIYIYMYIVKPLPVPHIFTISSAHGTSRSDTSACPQPGVGSVSCGGCGSGLRHSVTVLTQWIEGVQNRVRRALASPGRSIPKSSP